MNDVRYSFNSYPMTRLSVALGVAALSDQDYFEETTAKIVATRERTKQALTELGFTFGDSMTNFIFATHKTVPATHLFEELRKQHIFVRYFSNTRIDNYLRISIGTDAEMDRFITDLMGKMTIREKLAEDSDILIYVKKIEVALFMSRISDASGAVDEIRKGTVPKESLSCSKISWAWRE